MQFHYYVNEREKCKKMKVIIFTGSIDFSRALSNRFVQLDDRLQVQIIKKQDGIFMNEDLSDAVVVTDICISNEPYVEKRILFLEGNRKVKLSDFLRKNNRVISKFSPVNEILVRLKSIAAEIYDGELYCYNIEKSTKTIFLRSDMGGSGVTAISISLGRVTAARPGRRPLYINCTGSDNWKIYCGVDNKPLRPQRELEYMLNKGNCISLSDYVFRDMYGLSYLNIKGNVEALINLINKGSDFDTAYVDLGKNEFINFGIGFNVLNKKDLRFFSFKEQLIEKEQDDKYKGFIIENNSYCSMRKENIFQIVYDTESFLQNGCNLEIAMDRDFARGVRKLEEAINEAE